MQPKSGVDMRRKSRLDKAMFRRVVLRARCSFSGATPKATPWMFLDHTNNQFLSVGKKGDEHDMTVGEAGKLALLWPRDAPKWHAKTPQDYRLHRVFEAMTALGIEAEPAIYADDVADQVRDQLLRCDGVLVWVDPLFAGQNRIVLDALLRDVASKGVWVSAHPDVILKMGVKEVLHHTRHLGWGTDTHLYRNTATFREEFPQRLRAGGRAGPQTEPRQRWRGSVEGRALIRTRAGRGNRSGAACAPRQRDPGYAARRFHEPVRNVFRE